MVERELRQELVPHLEPQNGHDDSVTSHDGPAAHARHDQMIAPISDCACPIAGGMGRVAFDRITAAGIRAVITDLREPEEAALACAEGRMKTMLGRLHGGVRGSECGGPQPSHPLHDVTGRWAIPDFDRGAGTAEQAGQPRDS